MKCPNCGAEVGNSNVCEYCGTQISLEIVCNEIISHKKVRWLCLNLRILKKFNMNLIVYIEGCEI